MVNGTVERVVRNSLLYSLAISQPFSSYAYPVLENKILLESEELQYGDHGEAVRVLQTKLNKLSFYNDEIDGQFGLLTEHALKKFQNEHNITITGQAERETIYALVETEMREHLKKIAHLSNSIFPGLHSEEVERAQESLQFFGYYEGEIDGSFGPLTQKAIDLAEEKHDLNLTENIEAFQKLYEKEQEELREQQRKEQQRKEQQKKKESNIQKVDVKHVDYSTAINAAHSLIGTPYVWGGTSTNGFDCSGFIQYIFNKEGKTVPRTVPDLWNFGSHVSSPSIGDLVFFETYKPGPSHMGIYTGDGKFIHAGVSNGVTIDDLNGNYWKQRYLGAKRVQ